MPTYIIKREVTLKIEADNAKCANQVARDWNGSSMTAGGGLSGCYTLEWNCKSKPISTEKIKD